MILLFDNLNAIIIGTALILVLASVQIGSHRTGMEQTTSYATKAKAISFGQWIEEDVLGLGANFGRNRYRVLPPDTNAAGHTSRFTFFSDSTLASGDTLRLMTDYRLDVSMTVERGGEMIDLYQLHRFTAEVPVVDGIAPVPAVASGQWEADGHSLGTLSGFHIGLLERTGLETSDAERADYVRIEFRLVPEFPIEPEYLRELYWATTLKVRPFWEPPA